MKKKLSLIIASFVAVAGMAFAVPVMQPSYVSADAKEQIQDGVNTAGGSDTTADTLPETIKNIINIMLFIVGILSVIMIIFGGIRYVTSAGDPGRAKAAQNTIIYSIVGLVIAIIAFAIVNWVIGLF